MQKLIDKSAPRTQSPVVHFKEAQCPMSASSPNTHYVLGFVFTPDPNYVLLILKAGRSFDWQHGKLNGVGGAVDPGETAEQAMQRECQEETGLTITAWQKFATLRFQESLVHCYHSTTAQLFEAREQAGKDEPVEIHEVAELTKPNDDVLYNVGWLVTMARNHRGRGDQCVYEVSENAE